MANQVQTREQNNAVGVAVKNLLKQDAFQKKFVNLLGEKRLRDLFHRL